MKKVIIADDSATMRRLLSRMLGDMEGDFECLMTDGGDGVLQFLDEHADIDLVLLDWNMHVMNGLECLCAIRSREDTKTLPVVMVTVESRMSEAIESGANSYLRKPFLPETFQAAISPFLNP